MRANPGTKRLTLLAQNRDSTIELLLLDSSIRFPRDQEPRNDEKDVDTDEPAGEPRKPSVVGNDHQDCDGPHTFDVAPEALRTRRARGSGSARARTAAFQLRGRVATLS